MNYVWNMKTILRRLPAFIAALIFIQTLYFKFTAHPESVYIFTTLGMEPVGRISIGMIELIAALLLLFPPLSLYGAILGLGTISGALFFHFTKLGINVNEDGGYLFTLAVAVFICCALVLFIQRKQLLHLIHRVIGKRS